MEATIQFESNKVERAFLQHCEYSDDVIEYYDQPPPIKLTYLLEGGRTTTVMKTFDYFVVWRDGRAGWVECKSDEKLHQLADKTGRYQQNSDGTWSFPPGEEYANPYGLMCIVWSSARVNWTLDRNYTYLEEYFRDDTTTLDPERIVRIKSIINALQGILLSQLYAMSEICAVEEIGLLIARGELFVDISTYPLKEPEKVPVFTSIGLSLALGQATASQTHAMVQPHHIDLATGTRIIWAGQSFTILNYGDSTLYLKDQQGQVVSLEYKVFEGYVRDGIITGTIKTETSVDVLNEAIAKAGPEELKRANQRMAAIQGHLEGSSEAPMSRTIRRWINRFKMAEHLYGVGYPGLIDEISCRGNYNKRLPEAVTTLMDKVIDEHYLDPRQITKKNAYRLFKETCEKQGLVPASYKTFAKTIALLDTTFVIMCRQGRRAAYQATAPSMATEMTTARHGERPWEIVHIDHTLLDLELLDSVTRKPLGRPWLTLMVDATSRRVLAYCLSYEAPSYRSCMMVLREAVRRFNRLPQTIIVDNGREFKSLYFGAFLAMYEITRKDRPPAQARFGSILERLFGTINTQYIYSLKGNTQIMRNVRQVTKAVNPKNTAIWSFADFSQQLEKYLYEIYDTIDHGTLGESPRSAYTRGMDTHGNRPFRLTPYNTNFEISTLPTTPKAEAKVIPSKGVKVNNIFYWHEGFSSPLVARSSVSVRYDPYNIGHVYAFVNGTWVRCLSRYHEHLEGLTEHELKAVSAEIRMRYSDHNRNTDNYDQIIAQFIAENLDQEKMLLAQKRASEAKTLRSHITLVKSDAESSREPAPYPEPPQPTELFEELT